jgi:hypothetical protein
LEWLGSMDVSLVVISPSTVTIITQWVRRG